MRPLISSGRKNWDRIDQAANNGTRRVIEEELRIGGDAEVHDPFKAIRCSRGVACSPGGLRLDRPEWPKARAVRCRSENGKRSRRGGARRSAT